MTTQYVMRATHINSAPFGTVNWVVTGAADMTGAQSGYNIADLTSIAVDYTSDISASTTGGSIIGQSAWLTAYDINFPLATPQTFSADGNVTIDGKTWTVVNKANADTIAIDSTGLVFDCNANNSNYLGATRTAPGIFSALSNFIPRLDLSTPIRVWIYNSSNTADAASEACVFAIEKSTSQNYAYKKGFTTAATHQWSENQDGYNVSESTDTLSYSDDVMVIETDSIGSKSWRAYSGVYSNGWPGLSSMRNRRDMTLNTNFTFDPSIEVVGDGYVFLGAFSGNTSNNFVSKISRLKIEYLSQSVGTSIVSTLSDGYASLPSAGVPGRLFIPTDRSVLYRDNGSVWSGVLGGNYTALTSSFVQPAIGSTVTANVQSTASMFVGQYLYIVSGGYYTVSSITNGLQVVLMNVGDGGNAAAAATVANSSVVSDAGRPKITACANIETSESTAPGGTSGLFVDLTTAGPQVTLVTGSSTTITVSSSGANTATATPFTQILGVAVSGATTITAASNIGATSSGASFAGNSIYVSRTFILTGLTPGTNTFKLQYWANNSWNFQQRSIAVTTL